MSNNIEHYDTKYLEFLSKNTSQEIWVIVFDGKIIEGAKKRSFNSESAAKKSFGHLVWAKGRSSSDIRLELMKNGRLKFKRLET